MVTVEAQIQSYVFQVSPAPTPESPRPLELPPGTTNLDWFIEHFRLSKNALDAHPTTKTAALDLMTRRGTLDIARNTLNNKPWLVELGINSPNDYLEATWLVYGIYYRNNLNPTKGNTRIQLSVKQADSLLDWREQRTINIGRPYPPMNTDIEMEAAVISELLAMNPTGDINITPYIRLREKYTEFFGSLEYLDRKAATYTDEAFDEESFALIESVAGDPITSTAVRLFTQEPYYRATIAAHHDIKQPDQGYWILDDKAYGDLEYILIAKEKGIDNDQEWVPPYSELFSLDLPGLWQEFIPILRESGVELESYTNPERIWETTEEFPTIPETMTSHEGVSPPPPIPHIEQGPVIIGVVGSIGILLTILYMRLRGRRNQSVKPVYINKD